MIVQNVFTHTINGKKLYEVQKKTKVLNLKQITHSCLLLTNIDSYCPVNNKTLHATLGAKIKEHESKSKLVEELSNK